MQGILQLISQVSTRPLLVRWGFLWQPRYPRLPVGQRMCRGRFLVCRHRQGHPASLARPNRGVGRFCCFFRRAHPHIAWGHLLGGIITAGLIQEFPTVRRCPTHVWCTFRRRCQPDYIGLVYRPSDGSDVIGGRRLGQPCPVLLQLFPCDQWRLI